MPYEKAPSSGAFLPASLMYFLSGEPMHYLSGVDKLGKIRAVLARHPSDQRRFLAHRLTRPLPAFTNAKNFAIDKRRWTLLADLYQVVPTESA